MITHLVGLLISFFIVLHLWAVVKIYRQRYQSFMITMYLYFNGLIIVIEFCSLLMFREQYTAFMDAVFKIRFIAEAFIPPILFHLNQTYSLGSDIPKFTLKNIFLFLISFIFSGAVIFGYMYDGAVIKNGITYPDYTILYGLFIFYFIAILYYLMVSFIQKYRIARRKQEISNLKQTINFLLPLAILSFLSLHVLPLLKIIHPLVFLFYPVLSAIILYFILQLHFLEYDEHVSNSVTFFLTSLIYLVMLSFLPLSAPSRFFIFIIPTILFAYLLSGGLQHKLKHLVKGRGAREDYNLEEELENFVSEVGRFIDDETLAEFIAASSKKILKCTKSAVVVSRFDIRPYEIIFSEGFSTEMLQELISSSGSSILEKLEIDQIVINKFNFDKDSEIYRQMEKHHLYLAVPLVSQNSLMGFVFLGGDRKSMRIIDKDMSFARFLSVQAANALKNIRAIKQAVQAEKMAELGIMASQMAHDFQSFITLAKLEVPQKSRLRDHASYMEKLVQDLLNYARPQELRRSAVNINNLIDMSLDMVNIPQDVLIEKHYSESIPEIEVDSNQMRRVFLNFFENSIRAMKHSGGRIKITTRPLRPLSKVKRNPWIYIEILDDGEGIPEEFLERIFDPFFTTHKPEGGNGMGLAMVKQIISRHKGFIDVASKPGKGTIFNIRLPYIT